MLAKDCMTETVDLANPYMTLQEAALKMKRGDFGCLPIGENDRLVGMITDRDIAVRGVAEGKSASTPIREVMSSKVLYCFEDQSTDEVAQIMGENQVRRLLVLNRQKRLVGIIALGDIALPESSPDDAAEALGKISTHEHHEPQVRA